MDCRRWANSACRFALYASLGGLSSVACAAELFPYNPPVGTGNRQFQQRSVPVPDQLSPEELRTIRQLASEVHSLPTSQQKTVRDGVVQQLNDAVSRGDLRQIRYYNELLRQIGNAS